MSRPTCGSLRGVRAASLGIAAFVLALVAHLGAGGVAPGPVALVLLAGLIGLAAVLLTRVQLSALRIGISLGAMQVILHEVFMRLGAPADCVMTGASAPAAAPMGRAQLMLGCATSIAHAGMGQSSMFSAPAMVGAHVAATIMVAALLAYGENVLRFLAEFVRAPRWLRMGLPALLAMRLVSSGTPPREGVRFASGGVGRRGPPQRGWLAIV
jgi:hypothetical protein